MSTKLTSDQVFAWISVGTQLITVLSVPIAQVIALMKANQVDDETINALVLHWNALLAQIDKRIEDLQKQLNQK